MTLTTATTARAGRQAAALEPLGALADGTAYFVPAGEVIADGDLVQCHLCGCWRRSVTAHVRAHRWTKDAYCAAFGLERGQSLEGAATRKTRAASFTSRLLFDPAVLAGSARGRDRARSGELVRDAAAAARGRPLPEQRRRKMHAALAGRKQPGSAAASRDRARRQLGDIAAAAATRSGYPDIGALVRDRTAGGASLAAISREAGLHKDWLSRHLAGLDPAAAAAVAAARVSAAGGAEARWRPAITAAGFLSVGDYLRERHASQHWSVNQIAAEAGVSYHAVVSALERHGIARIAHAASRQAASERARQVAGALGCESLAEYVRERRAAGWTWPAMAAEAAQPQSWLRRQRLAGLTRPYRQVKQR